MMHRKYSQQNYHISKLTGGKESDPESANTDSGSFSQSPVSADLNFAKTTYIKHKKGN